MSFKYVTDSAVEPPKTQKQQLMLRNDFMDLYAKDTPFDNAGKSRPMFGQNADQWSNSELLIEYQNSGVAHKIVEKPAQDATRNGFRILIPDNPDLQDEYQKALDALSLNSKFAEELVYRGLFGDGFLSIGIENLHGKPATNTPIDQNNINNIAFIHPFSPLNVSEIQQCTDPTADNYMQESSIIINSPKPAAQVTKEGTVEEIPDNFDKIVLDNSRYLRSSLDRTENSMYGNSMLNRCKDAIQTMDSALYANIKLAKYFNLKVYNSQTIAGETNPIKREQYLHYLERGLSTSNLLVIGGDEKFQNIGTDLSGIDNLYEFAWQNLASASGIPKSVLTGEQSGTLAGASQDVINYYDGIRATQEQVLKPQIKYIVELLMRAEGVGGGSVDPEEIDWDIEFTPLWSTDDKTRSQVTLNLMQAANVGVTSGILSIDEAADWLKSQANNGNLTILQNQKDPDEKERQQKASDPDNDPENEEQGDSADNAPTKEEIKEYKKALKMIEQIQTEKRDSNNDKKAKKETK